MTLGHRHLHGHHHHNHNLNARVPRPLAQSLSSLVLDKIKLVSIHRGGYRIVFHGTVPPNGRVHFLLDDSERYFVDITRGYMTGSHKHPVTHLEQLLEAMARGSFWGKQIPVRVAVYSGGRMSPETLSIPCFIQCPLEPLRKIGIEEIGAIAGLRYTGKHDASGEIKNPAAGAEPKKEEKTGTILSHPINGRYYFIYAGAFETDAIRRGFDCTTYVGAAGGLLDGKGQGGTGKTVAEALAAQSCDMEDKHPRRIKEFFGENKAGTYVMWSHRHVVFVKNGFVHEFTDRVSRDCGYQKTEVSHWLTLGKHHKQTFSVRKVEV